MIDTHAHLNHSDFADDLPAVLHRAHEAGVHTLVVPAFDLLSSREAVALSGHLPALHAAVGLHPHSAQEWDRDLRGHFERLLKEPRVVAMGEIGLDFYRNLSPREAQLVAFRELATLGVAAGLPLIIHNRDAGAATLQVLDEVAPAGHTVIMHCFSGDRQFAAECAGRGWYLGLAGPLTYPKSEELRYVAAEYPAELLLLETDCPWLPPQVQRGRRNEPAWLPAIAAAAAAARGLEVAALERLTDQNARQAFRLPAPEVTG